MANGTLLELIIVQEVDWTHICPESHSLGRVVFRTGIFGLYPLLQHIS